MRKKGSVDFEALVAPVAGYLYSRFGKSQSPIGLLAIDVDDLNRKSQSAIGFSGSGELLVENMGVYMAYYRKYMMQPDDNPPVGILLCTEAGRETLEYVNTFIDPKLFVSKFQLQLPSKEEVTAFLQKENVRGGSPVSPRQTPKRKSKPKKGRGK